ncbi:HEAT repeat domain-containing protein, partial [Streptomyces sp. NPDC056672]|uniref:HEAT repeat domain-containing protein n=1 Tax=Streptomyces sp. NPDC056672 TaxID=3345906 RepID=UPI0036992C5F
GTARYMALVLLARHWSENPETYALVRDRAVTDPHGTARYTALVLLAGHWPEKQDIYAVFRDCAVTDPESEVRLEALRLWAAEPTDEVRDVLRVRARHDESSAVRCRAVWMLAFGWPTDQHTLPALQDLAVNDQVEDVRVAAENAVQVVEAIVVSE